MGEHKVNSPIYIKQVPSSTNGVFWVSFENHPKLKKTKADIYGRCLPCIQNLYEQLKSGRTMIKLGNAYQCWKITTILDRLETCFDLLEKVSTHPFNGCLHGKLGNGRVNTDTRVVVFHTQDEEERDRIERIIRTCLLEMKINSEPVISRACEVLYKPLFGDWRKWQPTSPIRYPQLVEKHTAYLKKVLYQSAI
jgi:hypothetical protein